MNKLEEQILSKLTIYYKSKSKALKWFNTPNIYFRDKLTPKQMIEIGKGNEVLDWINKVIE